ncbi:DUF4177 domain-containing protein [Ferruginibacter sp.]
MKFEYKILTVSREHMKSGNFQTEMLEKFNDYGEQGWELISTEGLNTSSLLWKVAETTELVFIFKRSK